MSDVLPILVLPALLLLALWQRRAEREARVDLRSAIAGYRGAPVTDAGTASLLAVAQSLALDPRDLGPEPAAQRPRTPEEDAVWQTAQIIRPLGLEIAEIVRVKETGRALPVVLGRTEISGIRHGRRVVVRLQERTSEVVVEVAVPDFEIRAVATGWEVLGEAPLEVREAIEDLSPSHRWLGLAVTGGAGGVRLHRAHESARSWMHDLWLAEMVTRHALRSKHALV